MQGNHSLPERRKSKKAVTIPRERGESDRSLSDMFRLFQRERERERTTSLRWTRPVKVGKS